MAYKQCSKHNRKEIMACLYSPWLQNRLAVAHSFNAELKRIHCGVFFRQSIQIEKSLTKSKHS